MSAERMDTWWKRSVQMKASSLTAELPDSWQNMGLSIAWARRSPQDPTAQENAIVVRS